MHLTGVLGVSSPPLAPFHCSCSGAKKQSCSLRPPRQQQRRRLRVARAVEVGAPSAGAPEPEQVEEPSIDFAFVSVSSSRSRPLVFLLFEAPRKRRQCARRTRVRDRLTLTPPLELLRALVMLQPRLLPDGTPDVHYRTARGGQKLRDIMLDGYIDLYGPYVSHCTRRRRSRSRFAHRTIATCLSCISN